MGYYFSRVAKVRNCLGVPIRIEAIKSHNFPEFVEFSKTVLPNDYIEIVYSDLRIVYNPYRHVNIHIYVDSHDQGIPMVPSYIRDYKQINVVPSAEGSIGQILIKGNMIMRNGCVVVLRRFAIKAGRGIGRSAKKLINQCKKEDTGVVDCTRPSRRCQEIEINGGVERECLEDQGQEINGTLKEDIFFLHSYYAVVACTAVGMSSEEE